MTCMGWKNHCHPFKPVCFTLPKEKFHTECW